MGIDVLEYIGQRGSLLGFAAARQERLTLMHTAIGQGLLEVEKDAQEV